MANSTRHTMPATPQSGAALVIALVFLLLMTILGVSSMQGTALQERMAGNQRDRNVAFQTAEAALRGGEIWLRTNQEAANDSVDAMPEDPSGWDGSNPTGTHNLGGQFYVGPPLAQCERVGIELPPEFYRFYPVSAHGGGASMDADAKAISVVVLQSMVKPPQSPYSSCN